jgi:5-methylcytosine-specific restriction endonuclease McrA
MGCKIKKSQRMKLYRARPEIKERTRQVTRLYQSKPEVKKKKAEWQKNNKELRCFWEANRRASKILRTPQWADLNKIKLFYKNCPKGMTVDHIIPLQGTIVSGLHVYENLQYLTHEENSRKGNKFST